MKKIFLIIIIVTVAFVSCKKSSDNNSCTLSTSSLAGNWYFTGATYKLTASSPAVDIYHDTTWFYPCETDNYSSFKSDGSYSYVDAGVSCIPTEDLNGTWTLRHDTIYTSSGIPVSVVTSFNCGSMVISYKNYDVSGDEALITYTKK
ncbi:MAG TPA: lipocalin family protein [Puia sp.]|nr:lipocalin family protein [Puia sp.]